MNRKTPARISTLSRSAEDYLEAIFLEAQDHTPVRVKEIGDRLGVAPASVTQAVKTLVTHGLVTSQRYGAIELTEEGYTVGKQISSSHHILSVFFEEVLGLNHDDADRAACIAEHGLAPDIIARLSCLVKWMATGHSTGTPLAEFQRHMSSLPGKPQKKGNTTVPKMR